jgi:hypothetical protein
MLRPTAAAEESPGEAAAAQASKEGEAAEAASGQGEREEARRLSQVEGQGSASPPEGP